jgi:conjugative relaxase-like TrwC/TraI family protein
MTGGGGYAQRHLQQSDYYDQNRTVEGQWHGRGAELLGLRGEVTSEDFEAVRQGLHPQTGEFLRQRHGADRFASNGEEQSKARSLYDMTFSAPKSVSVMAIVGGGERLVLPERRSTLITQGWNSGIFVRSMLKLSVEVTRTRLSNRWDGSLLLLR